MKKLQNRTLHFFNFIWSSLLSLIGLSACGSTQQVRPSQDRIMVKYGVPVTVYEIRGKVVDESGKPVPNVEVKAVENVFIEGDTTNAKGEFYVPGTTRFTADKVQLTYRELSVDAPADTIEVKLDAKREDDFSYKATADDVKIVVKK